MAFNIFRRKKQGVPEPEAPTVKGSAPLAQANEPPKKTATAPSDLPALVRKVHQTEKATAGQALNQYVFRVERFANKTELLKNVERHYGVHVAKIRILNAAGKTRRVKGRPGWKPGYKKAIVTVKAGEKIEVGV